LEVEPSDPAIAVEYLPDQIEARHQLGFHRPEIDLFEWDSSRCHFCVIPASILYDGKSKSRKRFEEMIAILLRELADGRVRIATDVVEDGFSESLGKPVR
jgi:hypothetical protein